MSTSETPSAGTEQLDPQAYHRMLRLYTAVATSPHGRKAELFELENSWPASDQFVDEEGNFVIDFEVGSLREVFVNSGSVRASAKFFLWNERIGEVATLSDNHFVKRDWPSHGMPLAYIHVTTEKPDSRLPEFTGGITGIFQLYQKNIIDSDFNLGVTGPDEDPVRQKHLLHVAGFLGLNPELITDEEKQFNLGHFGNHELSLFTNGLRNILAAGSNEIIL